MLQNKLFNPANQMLQTVDLCMFDVMKFLHLPKILVNGNAQYKHTSEVPNWPNRKYGITYFRFSKNYLMLRNKLFKPANQMLQTVDLCMFDIMKFLHLSKIVGTGKEQYKHTSEVPNWPNTE